MNDPTLFPDATTVVEVEPTPETPTLPIYVTDVAMSEGCTRTRTVRSVASVT